MFQQLLDHVPNLLFLYWTLATGAAVFTLLPGGHAPAFRQAVLLSAARGKLCDGQRNASLGTLIDWTVPQRWFLHFYIAGAACNSILLLLVITTVSPFKAVSLTSLSLLEVHLVRRTWETNSVLHYPANAKMHIIAYIFGISYYIVLPLSCVPQDVIRSTGSHSHSTQARQQLHLRHYMGVFVFLAGNMLQCWSHFILANLRSRTALQPKEQDFYKLPQGGPFELVSCPHYLGEIVIYAGLAILAATETPLVLIIFLWVVANLLLAAQPTHKWYQEHFKNYPVHRRALIPYLY